MVLTEATLDKVIEETLEALDAVVTKKALVKAKEPPKPLDSAKVPPQEKLDENRNRAGRGRAGG